MNSRKKKHISDLIKVYGREKSRESLICALAERDDLLEICSLLLQDMGENSRSPVNRDWLSRQCAANSVDLQLFLKEVAVVRDLFRSTGKIDDSHFLLGVSPGASLEAIKHAYRTLSKKYHPDTTPDAKEQNGEKFIELTRAYNDLVTRASQSEKEKSTDASWSSPPGRSKPPRHLLSLFLYSRRLYLWGGATLVILIIVFTLLSMNHRKRMMIAGLEQSRGDGVTTTSIGAAGEGKETADFSEHAGLTDVNTDATQETTKETGQLTEENSRGANLAENGRGEKISPAPDDSIEPLVKLVSKAAKLFHSESSSQDVVEQQRGVDVPVLTRITDGAGERTPVQRVQENSFSARNSWYDERRNRQPAVRERESAETPASGRVVEGADEGKNSQAQLKAGLEQFLKGYIYAYEQRNLKAFADYYAEGATENGQLFREMFPTYTHLFAVTTDLSLKLEPKRSNFTPEGVDISGRFKVYWHYRDSGIMHGAGTIRMQLIEDESRLKVKNVDYHFDKPATR